MHLERRLGGRVAAADDDDALAIVDVWLAVVVMDVRQLLARDAEQIRMVEIADRKHDVPRMPDSADAISRLCRHGEDVVAVLALDRQDLLAERNLQIVGIHDFAVVAERFAPGRLVEG